MRMKNKFVREYVCKRMEKVIKLARKIIKITFCGVQDN